MKLTGFSLLELLIVLSLLTIFSLITLPSLSYFFQKSNASVTLQQLEQALHAARIEAVIRNQTVSLCGSRDQQTCGGSWQNGFILHAGSKIIYRYQNSVSQSVLHWRGFPRNESHYDFFIGGMSKWQNGSFWFCPNAKSHPAWALILNIAGRMKERFPDKNGLILDAKGKPYDC